MIVNAARLDELIARRGAQPNLSIEDWQAFIALVIARLGADVCFRFCLYPYSHVPAKGYRTGFLGVIPDKLRYLNLLDLIVIDAEIQALLTSFLDQHNCPWELTTQYNPDTDADQPIGIRVFGYRLTRGEASFSREP